MRQVSDTCECYNILFIFMNTCRNITSNVLANNLTGIVMVGCRFSYRITAYGETNMT